MDLSGRSGWERVNAGESEWKPGGEGVKRVVSMLEGEEFGFLDIRVYTKNTKNTNTKKNLQIHTLLHVFLIIH